MTADEAFALLDPLLPAQSLRELQLKQQLSTLLQNAIESIVDLLQ